MFYTASRLTISSLSSLGSSRVGLWALSLLCLALPSGALGAQVTLTWNDNSASGLSGYVLYYGATRGSYDVSVDVGMRTTYTVSGLDADRVYYFAMAAYDPAGNESDLSPEIVHDGSKETTESDDQTDRDETDRRETDPSPVAAEGPRMDDAPRVALTRNARSVKDVEAIPQSQLTIVSVDSEELMGAGGAEDAIDSRSQTFWHTRRGTNAPTHPHEIVIALGDEYMVRGFRYLPRQDGKLDGTVAQFSFYVSEDGTDWGEPVATGTFPRSSGEKEVLLHGRRGSFVRFVAQSEVNGKPWTSMAEITILRAR